MISLWITTADSIDDVVKSPIYCVVAFFKSLMDTICMPSFLKKTLGLVYGTFNFAIFYRVADFLRDHQH